MASEIPLGSEGSQLFTIVIEGITYTFEVSYNTRLAIWTANISYSGGVVNGLGLLGGVDIINQIPFDLKNLYTVNLDNPNIDASPDDLGEAVKLYNLTDEEVVSLG